MHFEIVLQTTASKLKALTDALAKRGAYTADDVISAIILMMCDEGNDIFSDEAAMARRIESIFDACLELPGANANSFKRWREAFVQHDQAIRIGTLRGGCPTPVTWWPVTYSTWLLAGMPEVSTGGGAAMWAFRRFDIDHPTALSVMRACLLEPQEVQQLFVELLENRAFIRADLESPEAAINALRITDLSIILDRWRKGGRRESLRTIAEKVARTKRQTRSPKARQRLTPPVAAPRTEQRVFAPYSPAPIAAPAAPMTLDGLLKAHLPAKAQSMADAIAIALKVMKAEQRPWSINAIITRIRNMMGAAARVADRLIDEAFRWLAKRGVVENVGGYRLRDTTDDAIGQQILEMVP